MALRDITRNCDAIEEDLKWGFTIGYGSGPLPLPRRVVPSSNSHDPEALTPPPAYADRTGETMVHRTKQRIRAQLDEMGREIDIARKAIDAASALGRGIDRILSPKDDQDWLDESYPYHRKITLLEYEASLAAQRRRNARGDD
jgi:hypothetical protein